MASVLVNRRSQTWLSRRTGAVIRRGVVFALGVAAGVGLVRLAWPVPAAGPDVVSEGGLTSNGGSETGARVLTVEPALLPLAVDRARVSTVALEYAGGDAGSLRVATGIVVDDQGGVLSVRIDPPTAPGKLWAIDAEGCRRPARWVAADPETGLSLLEVESSVGGKTSPLVPISPATRGATLGESVFLIGNPYGLGHSVGRGHVAGLNRRIDLEPRPLSGLIQVQAPIHPGDNGALLADLQGEWLGLVRGGLALPESGAGSGDHDLGFVIPADEADWIARQLRETGRVDRAYLGILLETDRPGEPGAAVKSVVPDAPAALAGLKPLDRITAMEAHPIRRGGDLIDRLDRTAAGTRVSFRLLRDSLPMVLTIALGSRPGPPPVVGPVAPTAPPPAPAPAPTPTPRELVDQIERLQRQVEELQRRNNPAPAPAAP